LECLKEDSGSVCENVRSRNAKSCTFKEFEILTSEDFVNQNDESEEEDEDMKERNQEIIDKYRNITEKYDNLKVGEGEDSELILTNNYEELTDDTFLRYQTTIQKDPKQILRYYGKKKECTPLWVNSKNTPTEQDISRCEYCGSKRSFEFQVLPQLLYFLDIESYENPIDFGTLSIYTCDNLCIQPNTTYYNEYLYLQPFT